MIVVIGAGIAGLAAARELQLAGERVVVLEARERIGGRIHTDYASGCPIELGASWIHGSQGNAVFALARRFGLQTNEARHAPIALLDARVQQPEPADPAALQHTFERVLAEAKSEAARLEQDVPLSQAVHVAKARVASDCVERGVEWGLGWLGLIMGTDADRLSAKHWDQDEDLPGPDRVFPEGYAAVPDAVARGLDVRLGHEVRRVQWGSDHVLVQGSKASFECDAVVCTLPLGVLKSGVVTFDPPLPQGKSRSVARLGVGALDKVAMRFPAAFWPRHYEHIGCLPAAPGELIGFTNLIPYGLPPVLVGWFAGRFARSLARRSDSEVVERALRCLRSVLGERVTEPTYARVTRWSQDPHARGAYSHVAVDASGADYDVLAEPIAGRLFFGGEATYRRHPSTVHGAYMSGIREARRILAARGQGKRSPKPPKRGSNAHQA